MYKKIGVLLFLILVSLSSCSQNVESQRKIFEDNLRYMIGKTPQRVVDIFGRPEKYINASLNSGDGTYMIYYLNDGSSIYNSSNDNKCTIRFLLSESSDRVIDFDYKGGGCFFTMYSSNKLSKNSR